VLPTSPLNAATILGRALDEAHIPYAIGGALAYNMYGIPRATADLDVNVFVVALEEKEFKPLLSVLRGLGIPISEDGVRFAKQTDMIVTKWGLFPVEIFLVSSEFQLEAEKTRKKISVGEKSFYVLAPEAICVFKMTFMRDKDIIDVKNILDLQKI